MNRETTEVEALPAVWAVFDGWDADGFALSRFEPNVRVTRGLFECVDCGAKQAEYALPGSDGTVTCRPCERCGQEDGRLFYFLELFGRIGDGPEIDLVPIYNRDVWPLLQPTNAAEGVAE